MNESNAARPRRGVSPPAGEERHPGHPGEDGHAATRATDEHGPHDGQAQQAGQADADARGAGHARRHGGGHGAHMSYARFGAMVATSTVLMYGLMFLNTYALEHVFFSETRVYMALLMGAVMAVVMLAYMRGMYPDRRVNAGIFVGGAAVFALSLFLVRSQATVGQVSYMRAMIPHHSIAILTSERARITDPRVRSLADQIIETQRREIEEMRRLIADLENGR